MNGPDLAVTAEDGSCNVAMCPGYRRPGSGHDPASHREQDARHDRLRGSIHERIAALELAEDEGPYEDIDTRKLDELRADRNEAVFEAARLTSDILLVCLIEDIAEKLTCREAEAIADLYRSLGRDDDAEAVLDAHSYSDDEADDQHFGREVTPRCDICGERDGEGGPDWNGETGNHLSCEARAGDATLGPCGCTDYHMADCPLVTDRFGSDDPPEPPEPGDDEPFDDDFDDLEDGGSTER